MSQDTPTNGRVPLRDYIEFRFDALDDTLKQDRKDAKEKTGDHETRIRSLEKRITWSNVAGVAATAANAVLAMVGIRQ